MAALAVVNAFGDVRDLSGNIIADLDIIGPGDIPDGGVKTS